MLLHVLDDRLGRLADRLVYGAGADGQRVVRGLLRRMASTLPVDEVVPRLAEVAGRTVGGPRAEVRVTLTDGQQWSQVWPPDTPLTGSPITAGVRHAGMPVGEIEVDVDKGAAGATEQRLLGELAAPAGLALSTVRLTVELRQRIRDLERINAELRASSERLLTARRDEQRRLRHELDEHVVRHIQSASQQLATAVGSDAQRLVAAAAHCERALEELRIIARGIYPPRLAEAGLLVAIEGWLERTRLPVELPRAVGLDRSHREPHLEACLYFCAVTAIDALTSSGATGTSLRVDEAATEVRLEVSGAGARQINREASAAMRDRIEAFEGSLRIDRSDAGDLVMIFRAPLVAGGAAP
jgi:hypothetical protein